MPSCSRCGYFQAVLYPQGLCQTCFQAFQHQEFHPKDIEVLQRNVQRQVNTKLMMYPTLLNPVKKLESQDLELQSRTTAVTQDRPDLFDSLAPRPESMQPLRPPQDGRTSTRIQVNFHHYPQPERSTQNIKSTTALVLTLVGMLLALTPLEILAFPMEIMGLIIAIGARRVEQPNIRQKIAIIIALVYFIILIIGLIVILNDPEFLAELDALIAEQQQTLGIIRPMQGNITF